MASATVLSAGCSFNPETLGSDPPFDDGDSADSGDGPGGDGGDDDTIGDDIPDDQDNQELQRCQAALDGMSFDFEDGEQNWTHDRMPVVADSTVQWRFDHWEFGPATYGPAACRSGTNCWATNLEYNYISCQRGYLQSPVIDLSDCATTDVELRFHHSFDFWSGSYNGQEWFDGGIIEVSGDGGETWHSLGGNSYTGTIAINPSRGGIGGPYACIYEDQFYVDGQPGYIAANDGWQLVTLSIPADLRTADFLVRFVYGSGVSYATRNQSTAMQYTAPGWYIDDIGVAVAGLDGRD